MVIVWRACYEDKGKHGLWGERDEFEVEAMGCGEWLLGMVIGDKTDGTLSLCSSS